jgi:hypothetical protein
MKFKTPAIFSVCTLLFANLLFICFGANWLIVAEHLSYELLTIVTVMGFVWIENK